MEISKGFVNNFDKKAQNKPSFKGLTVETRNDGTKHHSFYSPGSDKIQLEILPLIRDDKGNYKVAEGAEKETISPKNTTEFLKKWEPKDKSSILNISSPGIIPAYRFKDGEKIILDEVRRVKINGEDYNLGWDPQRPDLKKARTIMHIMPDMQKADGPDRRNHFNMFGGTINDVIGKLDYFNKLGATRILSAPVFNNGPKNSNGYWTKNPYQVDPIRGSFSDFNKLQTELYKKGMGFIADGAFINESWEGVHVKDIMKYGKESPFLRWFEVSDPNKPLCPPLLPDMNNKKALQNLGIKLINAPYKLEYHKDALKPAEILENSDFDRNQPTKIQLFDKRFLSPEKQKENKVTDVYDIKELDNPNEVKSFDDSVQLASFEVEADKIKKALDKPYIEKTGLNPEKFLMNTDMGRNFKLTYTGEGSNIALWDGQNDIAKLRFFVTPSEELELHPDEVTNIKKASAQVQDNLVQVGEFWTGQTEKTLSEHTANVLSEKLSAIGKNSGKSKVERFEQAIKELAGTELPKESIDLINKEQIDNILNSKYDPETKSYTGSYNMQIAPLPKNITEGLMSYPLETIDFPDEICSVLAGPHVKKLASNYDLVGVSRYDLMKKPEYKTDYSETYKDMDDVYQYKLTPFVKKIINSSEVLKAKMPIDEKGDFATDEGKEIFRVVADDIVKFAVVKAFANTSPTEESLNSDKPKGLEFNREELAVNSFANWKNRRQASHEAEAGSIIDSINNGLQQNIKAEDEKKLTTYLEKRVKGLNGDALKVSKLIMNKTESGLEWRIDAARDAANMQKIMTSGDSQNTRTSNFFHESWDQVIGLWDRFIKGVKKENPKYYAIAESSNLHKVYPGDPVNKFLKKTKGIDVPVGNYPNMGSVERKFIEQTKFTTPTNYTYMFSTLPNIVHAAMDAQYTEKCEDLFSFLNKKLLYGWEPNKVGESPGFLRSAPADSILYSHIGVDNHDTSRALHGLSLDINEYSGNIKITDEKLQRWNGYKIGKELNKYNELDKIVNPKATLSNIFNIFDKAWGTSKDDRNWWYKSNDEDARWKFVIDNWQEPWVESKDLIANVNLTEKFKQEKKIAQKEFENNKDKIGPAKLNYAEMKKTVIPSIVMADTLIKVYKDSVGDKELKIPEEKRQKLDETIQKAIDNITAGSFKGKEYRELPIHFAKRAINHNWKDIVAEAKYLDPSAVEILDTKIKGEKTIGDKLGDKVYANFVQPGLEKVKAIELYKVILPGCPTVYNGEDTAETGFESNGKNVYLYNRNRLHHEWLKESPIIANFNNQLKDILNLRKNKDLSPLVNGQIIVLPQLKHFIEEKITDEKDKTKIEKKLVNNSKLYALYRYNKETDVIAVLNIAGFNNTRESSKIEPQTIPYIDTSRNGDFGITGGLDKGAVFVNALDKKDEYIVKEEGKLYKQGKDQSIVIDQPALILYRK